MSHYWKRKTYLENYFEREYYDDIWNYILNAKPGTEAYEMKDELLQLTRKERIQVLKDMFEDTDYNTAE